MLFGMTNIRAPAKSGFKTQPAPGTFLTSASTRDNLRGHQRNITFRVLFKCVQVSRVKREE